MDTQQIRKLSVVLGMLAASAIPLDAFAQVQPTGMMMEARTIRVSGTGMVRAVPDLATIQFAVETAGPTAQEVAQENADVMDRVVQALVRAGVRREDIRTSGYALYPEYAPAPRPTPDTPPTIRGYRASNQVAVRTTDLDGIGGLIDAGLEAGANRLSGVFFELQNPQAAQAQALQRAVEDARSSAETMAAALGVQLGRVLDASTSADPVRPLFRTAMGMDMGMQAEAAMAPTPIEPGEQEVRAMASLVFEIK